MRITIFLFFLLALIANSQDLYENLIYPRVPKFAGDKIIFSDNYFSKIYSVGNDSISEICKGPGIARYYSVDKKNSLVGVKLINIDGSQTPLLINLKNNELIKLSDSRNICSQISFTDNAELSFVTENILNIYSTNSLSQSGTITLNDYSNIAPLSPDGRFVCFNNHYGELCIYDRSTGLKRKITYNEKYYYNPVWSPNSNYIVYSRVDGHLFLFDIKQNITYEIGEGENISWNKSSEGFVYFKKDIFDMKILNSDLYFFSINDKKSYNLTNTKDIFEIDPDISDNNTIIYSTINSKEIITSSLNSNNYTLFDKKTIIKFENNKLIPEFFEINNAASTLMDIPYVNQVYDTPDWFNGHSACGATTAIMLIAYHKILPPWETRCSTPSFHLNDWGMYVSEKYRFKLWEYIYPTNDPNGKAAYGGFGYTWNGGSPSTKLAGYYTNHGITSVRKDSPPLTEVETEVINGRPYTLCVGLTSSGHIILAHGLGTKTGTILFNDPYGNKNKPGYPNYLGKNCYYDWPGINNGNMNLSTVFWSNTSSYNKPAVSDSIIDDLEFTNGFYIYNKPPASMYKYTESVFGYNNHSWWVWTLSSDKYDSAFVTWTPKIPRDGLYDVSAYIATSTCTKALYKVNHRNGISVVPLNQQSISNAWQSIGQFNFSKGTTGFVRLGDGTGKLNERVVFDAMKFTLIDSVFSKTESENQIPASYSLNQNFPNPFNSQTNISFKVAGLSNKYVSIRVYDILGNLVETIVNSIYSRGNFDVKWNSGNNPSGTYFYQIKIFDSHSGQLEFIDYKKMMLLK